MLALIINGPLEKALQLISETEKSAQAYELRLDTFDQIKIDEIRQIREAIHVPIIFTIRKESQGGHFRKEESERIALMEKLFTLNPTYFDLEYDIPLETFNKWQERFPQTQLICSYHDFNKTPDDLFKIYDQIRRKPAAIYKIVTYARSTLDSIRMLRWIQAMEHPTVGLCMGELGQITRIFGKTLGNVFNYAPYDEEGIVAPGQIPYHTLEKIYRYSELNESTHFYGLIGNPVSQSISNLTYNPVFELLKQNCVHAKIHLRSEELKPFFELIEPLPFKGFHITIPHKEHCFPYIDHLEKDEEGLGAINTLALRHQKWWGYNTDRMGALNAIEAKQPVKGKHVVILGAGGTAKAIAFEAKKRDASLTILNRTTDKAKQLAEKYNGKWGALEDFGQSDCEILINATSVGMAPDIESIPIDPGFLDPSMHVMDVIAKPRETALIKAAQEKGCLTTSGYEMFILQAVEQFAIWFGDHIDREAINDLMHNKDRVFA